MDTETVTNPSDDMNVEETIELQTSATIPQPLAELASQQDQESFMENLPLYTEVDINTIEELTRDQSANEQWREQRKGRITASLAHAVMTHSKSVKITKDPTSLVDRIMGRNPPNEEIPALKYGRAKESEAREAYISDLKTKHVNLLVTECGLFVKPDKMYMGASPDGVVRCDCCGDGLLEIKCPITLAGLDPNTTTVPFVEEDASGCKVVKKSHQYYSQMVYQMGVTNRSWCDLVVFSTAGHLTLRIEQDHERWEDLQSAADYFFIEHIVRALYAPDCTSQPQSPVQGPPGREIF